ncbi:hypothetical protein ACS0TY_000593 [Phlomoides rotata]
MFLFNFVSILNGVLIQLPFASKLICVSFNKTLPRYHESQNPQDRHVMERENTSGGIKTQRDEHILPLPQETIEGILSRLSVKSLLKFRLPEQCSWQSLLKEPVVESLAFDDLNNIRWDFIDLVGCCNGLVCILLDSKSCPRNYLMKSIDNSWKTLNGWDLLPYDGLGKFASGNFHWILSNDVEWHIFSFDLKGEAYRFVQLPSCSDGTFNKILGVIEGMP